MNKTAKKLEKNVVKALTQACESCKEFVTGFDWLTHTADYSDFPASLHITCVFDSEDAKVAATVSQHASMMSEIENHLANYGVTLNKIERHVSFDSEQACKREHGGNWQLRLAQH